ncbi:MAG: uroporphyrinogen-III C-methyltransferase [Vicinamibacterales bacterium]
MTPPTGRVFIIGAGPGDPGLMTVRGVRLLAEATVVVYDRNTERVLRWARPDAEMIEAGAPAERDTAQDALSMLVAEKARDGHIVARVKWGDPFVFDSGAKEALFLHEQGVPFEVVPGIPAAMGMSAYAGVPLTYPGAGDALVLVRGQEDESGRLAELDWQALARVDGTLACFAGARMVPAILQRLLDHGAAPDTPGALIYHGTTPTQRTVTGTLRELLDHTAAAIDPNAALLILGAVTGLRNHLRWFDERPLFGRRIVVTRSPEQADDLVDRLESLGAQAISAPTFRMASADDPEAVDRAAASVDDFQWVVFEAASAVTRFLGALSRGPRDIRAFGAVRVCAIGPSTADRLIAAGIKPDVVVAEVGAESIGDAIADRAPVAGQRVLIVRPDHVRATIGDDLERRGAHVVDLVAYRTAAASPDSPAAQHIYRLLLENRVDAVTFTSPTAVRRFAGLIGEEQAADLLNTTIVAAIGPVTAAAARALGVRDPLVPDAYSVEGLVRLLTEQFRSSQLPV